MLDSSLEIDLGGKLFKVGAFTVGQLEELHAEGIEFEILNDAESARKYYAKCLRIIAAAVSADHPEITVDTLRKMRLGTFTSIAHAVSEILIFGGIWKRTEKKEEATAVGEVSAAA